MQYKETRSEIVVAIMHAVKASANGRNDRAIEPRRSSISQPQMWCLAPIWPLPSRSASRPFMFEKSPTFAGMVLCAREKASNRTRQLPLQCIHLRSRTDPRDVAKGG